MEPSRPAPKKGVRHRMIGQMLVEGGLLTQEQLTRALEEQKRRGGRLGGVLKAMGMVDELTMIEFLGRQLGIPHVDLSKATIDPDIVTLIPEALARRTRAVPINRDGKDLTVAMVDPLNVFAIDDIRRTTGLEIVPVVATEREIMKAIDRHYTVRESMEEIVRGIDAEQAAAAAEEEGPLSLEAMADETPVVKLVNMIITQADRDRASDVHIEPDQSVIRIRYRIDGLLRDVMESPKHLHAGLSSRLKIMASMDIAEKRVPQDGRFEIGVGGKAYDVRMSTLPTLFGEKIVLRLLEKGTRMVDLAELGLDADLLAVYEKLVLRPHGFILVTGPTGSGKTTTIYASVARINSAEKNIITIEDPIEYQLARVNQVPLNPKAGVTFASGLRAIVRQDPDVIMVGEIRDSETATIAIHAALTGHLVFSTLHTNDAAGAVARLVDMGVEPFLIASSLLGVAGQRLARRLCLKCRASYEASPDLLKELGLEGVPGPVRFYRAVGCPACRQAGYLGRVGIFELMTMSESLRRMVVAKETSSRLRAQAIREGMRSLREDGLRKAAAGLTSVEEILRVTTDVEE